MNHRQIESAEPNQVPRWGSARARGAGKGYAKKLKLKRSRWGQGLCQRRGRRSRESGQGRPVERAVVAARGGQKVAGARCAVGACVCECGRSRRLSKGGVRGSGG